MTDEGGDAACWLDRVCERCGEIPLAGVPHRCRDSVAPPASAEAESDVSED